MQTRPEIIPARDKAAEAPPSDKKNQLMLKGATNLESALPK
jgi:hypothetical protein